MKPLVSIKAMMLRNSFVLMLLMLFSFCSNVLGDTSNMVGTYDWCKKYCGGKTPDLSSCEKTVCEGCAYQENYLNAFGSMMDMKCSNAPQGLPGAGGNMSSFTNTDPKCKRLYETWNSSLDKYNRFYDQNKPCYPQYKTNPMGGALK